MKLVIVIAMAIGGATAQENINYKPCQDVLKRFEQVVKQFNGKGRKDGLQIQLYCTFQNPETPKPERHVDLAPEEIIELNKLRKTSDEAFDAQIKYEKHIFSKHHIKILDYGNPCWYYVGIKSKDNFISIDPNAMYKGCSQ